MFFTPPSAEVTKGFTLSEEAVQGDDAGSHIYHWLGYAVEGLDLVRPVELEGEREDDELEVVGEYFEVDGANGALVLHRVERCTNEKDNGQESDEKDCTEKEGVLPLGGTLSTLELAIPHVACLALGTQDALVAWVALALRIEVTLRGAKTGTRNVAVEEVETGGTRSPVAWTRAHGSASEALCVIGTLLTGSDCLRSFDGVEARSAGNAPPVVSVLFACLAVAKLKIN